MKLELSDISRAFDIDSENVELNHVKVVPTRHGLSCRLNTQYTVELSLHL